MTPISVLVGLVSVSDDLEMIVMCNSHQSTAAKENEI